MIPKHTIDQIFEAAYIEEVVGEFVHLKKQGATFRGLSPFTNEKTPSFYVIPAKGIYKCFSSGKGGNAVSFLMEYEKMTYPEALRWLAAKYNIEIEEEQKSPEQALAQTERESIAVVMAHAQQYFTDQLMNSEEGKTIGLSYFKERGFRDDIIKKFQLGYNPEGWDTFTTASIAAGYEKKWLMAAGLTRDKDGKAYDFFRGRVMFPIRNVSGKVIAFGGRTLKTEKKIAKYFNSPENVLYNKSKVLYGIYLAKAEMSKLDMAYLVEGYTDVIAMHQAGVENVVASSGTSLTEGQIKLISRYTKNITMLYDGDPAGIRASFRGIDLILQQGLNVKVVLFPDGDDPDSYSKKVSSSELQEYIQSSAKDFIVFKTDMLLSDVKGDPTKRAALITEIVTSIAKIPDSIKRSVYIQECSSLLGIEERVLINEMNRLLRQNSTSRSSQGPQPGPPPEEMYLPPPIEIPAVQPNGAKSRYQTDAQEADFIRLLLNFGNYPVRVGIQDDNTGEEEEVHISVAEYLLEELEHDQFELKNEVYQRIVKRYAAYLEKDEFPDIKVFTNNDDISMVETCVQLMTSPYAMSTNWELRHGIYPETEDMKLDRAVRDCINRLKLNNVMELIHQVQEQIKAMPDDDQLMILLHEKKKLDSVKMALSNYFGSSVL
ncbi:MAG: DNA primase [Bacteroidetes bacterium]|nr:DNA primase [Bacteroidota bacterium]